MVREPDVALVAGLLGDSSRAAMCLSLMDGRMVPAGELAQRAGISAQAASNHLAKLIEGGIVAVEHRGRWRYYRLTCEEVAYAVEALALIAPQIPRNVRGSLEPGQQELYAARTCYRHLAGQLGVALTDALLNKEWIATEGKHYAITREGIRRMAALGIDFPGLRLAHQILARKCLDWSERRPHLSGPLGLALADLAFSQDWIRRRRGTRSVLVTPLGRAELKRLFQVNL
jgi:DNA-binding transcriptional ArsR family regulator